MLAVAFALLHCAALSVAAAAAAAGPFRFSNTHGDHMVLQQAPAKAQIWGFGTAGQSVSVVTTAAGGTPVKATVAPDGTWQVALDPVKASGNPVTVTATSGTTSITLKDVLYGDVWFCSGQSNMQFTVDQAFNASAEVAAAANFPHIRLFTAANVPSLTPLTELAANGVDRSEIKISPEQGSVLFNGMVHPFIRTTIYGAIW